MIKPNLTPRILDFFFLTFSPVGRLDYGTLLSPYEYLSFARTDLEDRNGKRSIINAISNAKRALHLQVETISSGYGYKVIQKSRNFPEELEFLQNLGLVTPTILKKLNAIRNNVEHEYSVPNEEDAELFCDVVELFLYATEGSINLFPDALEFSSEACDESEVAEFEAMFNFPPPIELSINIEPSTGELLVYTGSVFSNQRSLIGKVNIKHGSEYFDWIKKIYTHTFRRL